MTNVTLLTLLAAAAAALPAAPLHAEGSQSSVAVYYPGKSWVLRYEADGVLEQYNNHKQGHSTYATALSQTTGVVISAQIAPAHQATTAVQCRDQEHAHIRKSESGNAEVKFSEASGTDMEVVVVMGPANRQVTSRHLHRFWLRDGLCAKVHVSKTPFFDRDGEALSRILASARLEPVPAAGTLERAFVVPGRGTLTLTVPAHWGFRTSKPERASPREITFMEPTGDHRVMLTLFPAPERVLRDGGTREFVASARDKMQANALEADVKLQDLRGAGGAGHHFAVTDKDLAGKPPRAGDWTYLNQGALMVGPTLLVFSVFSNTKDGAGVASAFAAIRGAQIE